MRQFEVLSDSDLVSALVPPEGEVSAVLDTDTFNEIDDQYALAYAELAPNIRLEAVYAAPFFNGRSRSPEDGMEKSYEEIMRLRTKLAELPHEASFLAFKGARGYLSDVDHPERSDAAEDLIARAKAASGRLYVLAIAAPTNVVSALLLAPEIRRKIVVVWLGGQPLYWPTAREFNLEQDRIASQLLFDFGVPLVNVPCKNVAEHLRVSVPELARHLKGKNGLSDYLLEITTGLMEGEGMLSKVIWDIAAVAWLRSRELISTHLLASPILTDRLTWSRDVSRHLIRVAYDVDRDAVFRDLFGLIAPNGAAS